VTPLARGLRLPGRLLLGGDNSWVVLVLVLLVVGLAVWLARRR